MNFGFILHRYLQAFHILQKRLNTSLPLVAVIYRLFSPCAGEESEGKEGNFGGIILHVVYFNFETVQSAFSKTVIHLSVQDGSYRVTKGNTKFSSTRCLYPQCGNCNSLVSTVTELSY